ncbi:MAG: hypothetical protein KatS3mg023_3044 [Armatimonadota bacterium]|nr:MAG: hypothetical protein KatS3mg023_3044 [Armatimonadota bacterium]
MRQGDKVSKKKQALQELFEICQQRNDWYFDNDEVKRVCAKYGFGNPFDVTKVDTTDGLPDNIRKQGYCVIHLGKGKHAFIREMQKWYHLFEDIEQPEVIQWRYRKSLLNDLDTGEASVLSFVYNQHILHDFLYEDVVASPKIYVPGRTRAELEYWVGGTLVQAPEQQMEMDLTLEYQGTVTVLEAKSRFMKDFAVYQLFHPVKFYLQQASKNNIPITNINACYVLRQSRRVSGQTYPETKVRLYLYCFDDPCRIDSLRLVRKAEYHLYRR